jgi:CubicO group peptidase (beta-lactamase class C family)
MKKWILGIVAVIAIALGISWFSMDKDMRNLASNLPTDRNVLFWNDAQRSAAFRTMDRLPVLAKANIIEAGDKVYPLPKGAAIKLDGVDAYMTAQRTSGLVIVQDGKIRFEKYGLDFDSNGKWTSFSVAKSMTSTMVGAAIKDGYIKSIDDKVTDYIPEMKGSAYDDVTVGQLLTMTSGIKWNEDYGDPKSDVARFNEHKAEPGIDTTVSYMRKLPREAPAGKKWVYKTGETNLIGVLVSKATKKKLSDYLAEKVWTPFGMEQDASWLLGSTGHEISGCCIQASTRDFARFGQFILGGGVVNGKAILPDGWIAKATVKQADIGDPGRGYGYQWWTYDDGTYAAQGIFGQGIFIDPKRRLVIASNSNWPSAVDPSSADGREAFYKAVQKAIDAELASKPEEAK